MEKQRWEKQRWESVREEKRRQEKRREDQRRSEKIREDQSRSEQIRADQRRSEKIREEEELEERVRRKKMQAREKVEKSRVTVFLHAVVARSTFQSQKVENTSVSDHLWKLTCRKSARRSGANHILKSKGTKHLMFEVRNTFRS